MTKVKDIIEFATQDNTIKWLRLVSLFIGVYAETKWYIQKKFDLKLILGTIVIALILGYSGKIL